jgi:hypothetical protein
MVRLKTYFDLTLSPLFVYFTFTKKAGLPFGNWYSCLFASPNTLGRQFRTVQPGQQQQVRYNRNMNSIALNNNLQIQPQMQIMSPQPPRIYNNSLNMYNRGMMPVAYPNPYYSQQPPPPPPGFGMDHLGSVPPPPPPGYAQAMMATNLNQPTF